MRCNICNNSTFVDMNTRKNVRCEQCNSLERTRLLWMYLQKIKVDKSFKILHLAPEKPLYDALSKLTNNKYYDVADINPKLYSFAKNCKKIDLCHLNKQPSLKYDLIIHSHVLEHTPCNIAYTLFHLHRMLKKNGQHVCVIPFMGGKYDESFQELSSSERQKRFGQLDHVRRFGKEDIPSHIGKLINIPAEFDATKDFSIQDLINANIPENVWKGFHTNTILKLKRNDMIFIHE